MDDQIARIVEARMKLRARFLHDVEATPSIADDRPMGSSTTNRWWRQDGVVQGYRGEHSRR